MSDANPPATPARPFDYRRNCAFGLPPGSVRALLSLTILGAAWALMVLMPKAQLPYAVRDLMFLILGHYFAVERAVRPEDVGVPPPLYLPRGSIRALMVLGFAAVVILLFRGGQLFRVGSNPGGETVVLISGFMIGILMAFLGKWWRSHGRGAARFLEDVKASVALLAALILVLMLWNHYVPFMVPRKEGFLNGLKAALGENALENLLAAVIGFYFGSRS